jgi:O-antigen ligase
VDDSVVFLLMLAIILALTVKHWVNGFLFILFFICTIRLIQDRPAVLFRSLCDLTVTVCLAAPFLAVAIGQIMRFELLPREFDAPSRLLLAVPVFLFLRSRGLEATKHLDIALGSAIILAFFLVDDFESQRFGGRFATVIADTNTFGSYLAIFTVLTFNYLLNPIQNSLKIFRKIFLFSALALGMYLVFYSQSRGAWIALFFGFFLMAAFAIKDRRLFPIFFISFVTTAGVFIIVSTPILKDRAISIFQETAAVSQPTSQESSIIHREQMSEATQETAAVFQPTSQESSFIHRARMSEAALLLIKEKWLSGYGDRGYASSLESAEFQDKFTSETLSILKGSGPHNEFLGRFLQSGVWGFLGVLLVVLIPLNIFLESLKHRSCGAPNSRAGILFITTLFVLMFSTEPFALRFTASLNGLLLVIFLSASLKKKLDLVESER